MRSKEENVLGLFFNQPTKEWHFEDVVSEAKIARSKANKWLKQFIKEGLIKRIKTRGRMPYYVSEYDSPEYKNRKKFYAFGELYHSGFLNHLSSLPKAKTIIIFGSFARSDWYEGSDIDLFIYGDPDEFKQAKYELELHRDIQVFVCRNKKTLAKFGEGLIRNIVKGNLIKGDLSFLRIDIDA